MTKFVHRDCIQVKPSFSTRFFLVVRLFSHKIDPHTHTLLYLPSDFGVAYAGYISEH